MMLKLGFFIQWVDMIMLCVTLVRYSVKVSDQIARSIMPNRGLGKVTC